MHSRLIGLLLLLYAGWAPAASVYKWVDKEGNVQFSQTPPQQAESRAAAREIELEEKVPLKPEKRLGRYYCGERQLPRAEENGASRISNLQYNIEDWQHQIEKLQQSRLDVIKRSARSRYGHWSTEELARISTDISELECGITWAEGELDGLSAEKEKIIAREEAAQRAVAEVEQHKTSRCGVDNRTGIIAVDEEYRAYKKCVEPFDREISRLKKELKRARQDRELVAPL